MISGKNILITESFFASPQPSPKERGNFLLNFTENLFK
jgi:hypothetical protein